MPSNNKTDAVTAETENSSGEKEKQEKLLLPRNDPQAAPKGNFASLAYLLPFMMRSKAILFGAILFLLLASALNLAVAILSRPLIDQGVGAQDPAIARFWVILMGIVLLLAAMATATRFFLVTVLGERVTLELRDSVFKHLLGLDRNFYDRHKVGEIISGLTADTTLIQTVVGSSASIAARSLLTLIGSVTILLILYTKLTLFAMLAISLTVLPIMIAGRRVRGHSTKTQDKLAVATGRATEALTHSEIIQAYSAQDNIASRYRQALLEAYYAAVKRIRSRSFLTFLAMSMIGLTLLGFLYSATQLGGDDDGVSAGALSQFSILAIMATGACIAISDTFGDVMKAAGAMDRLHQILILKSEIKSPANPKSWQDRPKGKLEICDLTFSYPGNSAMAGETGQTEFVNHSSEHVTLSNISFSVNPGETIAVVGPSGAGKTTLFRLLMRFYNPDKGDIFLDNIAASETSADHWRQQFALVSQNPSLFSGSIAENLQLALCHGTEIEKEATDRDDISRLQTALDQAQASMFVDRLGGVSAEIGDRGTTLSGGQQQRLAIARALLADAPILLLDEATSALDSENEAKVQAAFAQLKGNSTSLVIAHRLATVRGADRILVLDQGKLVEQGNHESLIAAKGLYAKLAAMQFQNK